MDFQILFKKLQGLDCGLMDIFKVMSEIDITVSAFQYAKQDIKDLAFYVVIRNNGEDKVLKTIKGHIVAEKLDSSYIESRELLGVGSWNVRACFKVYFDEGVVVERVTERELHRVLFDTVEPKIIKYVLGVEDGEPKSIVIDLELYEGMKYNELRDSVTQAYNRFNSKVGTDNSYIDIVFRFCVVDYEV